MLGATIKNNAKRGYMSETNELRPGELSIPEAVLDAVIEALGDCYDCTRVWNAWSHGTMSQNDFVQVAESPERVEEIARAAITALFLSESSGDESLHPTELDTLRVRVGEMAAEIERLNGVIAQREQESLSEPDRSGVYFYKVSSCAAPDSKDSSCICWHQYGSGPLPDLKPDGDGVAAEREVPEGLQVLVDNVRKWGIENTGNEPSVSCFHRSLDVLVEALLSRRLITEREQGDLIQGNCYEAGLWSMRNADAMIQDGNVINGESLRATCTMGVGDGTGNLFVHGDYDSIKAAQRIVLERDRLRAGIVDALGTENRTATPEQFVKHLKRELSVLIGEVDDGGHVEDLPPVEPRCPSSLHDTSEVEQRIAIAELNATADRTQRRKVGKTWFEWRQRTQRWSICDPQGAA